MVDRRVIIYAFIDSQNLNLSIRNNITTKEGRVVYRGWELDFRRFLVYLRDKYQVARAFLFIGFVPENTKLYHFLEEIGYQVIYKPTLEYMDGEKHFIKGNVDAELVLHAMIEFPNYDKAIIVSGDGDYNCLIEHLEKSGKLSHIMIPNKYRFSSLLRTYHQYMIYVSDLRSKLEKTKKRE